MLLVLRILLRVVRLILVQLLGRCLRGRVLPFLALLRGMALWPAGWLDRRHGVVMPLRWTRGVVGVWWHRVLRVLDSATRRTGWRVLGVRWMSTVGRRLGRVLCRLGRVVPLLWAVRFLRPHSGLHRRAGGRREILLVDVLLDVRCASDWRRMEWPWRRMEWPWMWCRARCPAVLVP